MSSSVGKRRGRGGVRRRAGAGRSGRAAGCRSQRLRSTPPAPPGRPPARPTHTRPVVADAEHKVGGVAARSRVVKDALHNLALAQPLRLHLDYRLARHDLRGGRRREDGGLVPSDAARRRGHGWAVARARQACRAAAQRGKQEPTGPAGRRLTSTGSLLSTPSRWSSSSLACGTAQRAQQGAAVSARRPPPCRALPATPHPPAAPQQICAQHGTMASHPRPPTCLRRTCQDPKSGSASR